MVCVNFCATNVVCSRDFEFEELPLVALHSFLIHVFTCALSLVVIDGKFRGQALLVMVFVEFDCTSGIAP